MTLSGSGKKDGGHSQGAKEGLCRPAAPGAANAIIIPIDDGGSTYLLPEAPKQHVPTRAMRHLWDRASCTLRASR